MGDAGNYRSCSKPNLPEREQPQAHRPSRAPARAGQPYPAVNCEIDFAPALFPLIARLVLGEVSSGHHAASPYLTGSPHVRFAPIASAVGTAAKRAERRLLRCGISTRLMTGWGLGVRKLNLIWS